MDIINLKLQRSKQKLTSLPFRKIAPNIVTTLALCAGITSIRHAIAEDWKMAVMMIFLAAFFDMLDGRVARMLKGSTKFGAELDSLSDFVSFGVAPAILIYKWALFDMPIFGWFVCLLLSICSAMRLARFNTMLDNIPQPKYWDNFFVGVPAPAAACIVLLPLMLSFEFEGNAIFANDIINAIIMSVVAILMVSKIPTISTKKMKVPTYLVLPMLIMVIFFAALIVTKPWLILSLSVSLYIITLPLGIISFVRVKKVSNRI